METLIKARDFLREKGCTDATAGVVLGTGLDQLLHYVDIAQTIPYADIPGFPEATVSFHKGQLIYGGLGGKKVVILQGRLHAYEGYTPQQLVFPIRVLKLLGIQHLLLSNAAGGIRRDLKKGDLVALEDHINLQSGNPLTGKNLDDLGPRFPDMSQPYDANLRNLLTAQAKELNLTLKEGVYAAVQGPNLETRAEYRYLKIIGADIVGMSTVPEVIAAAHMGLPCAAVSVITDECDPEHLKPVNMEEIIAVAGKADQKLSALFHAVIAAL